MCSSGFGPNQVATCEAEKNGANAGVSELQFLKYPLEAGSESESFPTIAHITGMIFYEMYLFEIYLGLYDQSLGTE